VRRLCPRLRSVAEGTAATPRGPVGRWATALLAVLLGLGLSLLPLLPGGSGSAAGAERQLELSGFQLLALVARDGSMRVSETLTARFEGKWNGLRREIPMMANRPQGRQPLGLRLLSASDGAGHPYRVETRRKGDNLEWRIFVPGAEDATRTVVLRYRVRNAVRFYPKHDELNWNVTGNAWEIPIERVEARVWLPEGVKGLHASVYTGLAGARDKEADLEIGQRDVTAVSTRRLEPGEGLTLAVGFQKGLVTPGAAAGGIGDWLEARLALFLPLLTALILGPIWLLFGRDPGLGAVPVVYEPPEGLTPAVLGCLVRQSLGSETLGATLVDLAVKGHLRIQLLSRRVLFLPGGKTYQFTLRTPSVRWRELAAHESYLLAHLFPAGIVGASVSTDELRHHFYLHVPGFQALLREAVLAEGFYHRWPGTVRAIAMVSGVGAAVAMLVVARMVLPGDLFHLQSMVDPLFTDLCLLATLLLIGLFAWIMPSRTPRGVQVLRKTLGFQAFLRRVEAPRYKSVILTPELFERYLPFAIVAGLTKRWAEAFQGIVQAPPNWYVGSDDNFDIGGFSSSLDDCCRATSGAMQASPSSSGSGDSDSGSSGGGSSGGGDGGGGGGGF